WFCAVCRTLSVRISRFPYDTSDSSATWLATVGVQRWLFSGTGVYPMNPNYGLSEDSFRSCRQVKSRSAPSGLSIDFRMSLSCLFTHIVWNINTLTTNPRVDIVYNCTIHLA